jgi:hypothetical protein
VAKSQGTFEGAKALSAFYCLFSADLPVKINQDGIHCLQRAITRGRDQLGGSRYGGLSP